MRVRFDLLDQFQFLKPRHNRLARGEAILPRQPAQHEGFAGVGEFHLGSQHKHRQPLQSRRQQIAAHDERDVVRCQGQADEARLHPALGRTESGQARLTGLQQQEILGQLVMKKRGRVFALRADHAQMGQGGDAFQRVGHR